MNDYSERLYKSRMESVGTNMALANKALALVDEWHDTTHRAVLIRDIEALRTVLAEARDATAEKCGHNSRESEVIRQVFDEIGEP